MTRGERNIEWIQAHLRVPEGKDVGKPLRLRPFQRAIVLGIYDNVELIKILVTTIRKGFKKLQKENSMITFKWKDIGNNEKVFLNKKHAGTIKRVEGGWQYFPKGHKTGGEIFKKISECEDSLKEE